MSPPWLTTEEIQNYGLWLQSGAIVVSLLGVLVGVTITTGVNRKIARRRATLDLIMAQQSNDFLIRSRHDFIVLREAGNLVQWAVVDSVVTAQQTTLRAAINRYELIAIGIKQKTLDGSVYKSYARSGVIRDWLACKPWVMQMRQTYSTPAYYCEFEKLAKKWATREERKHC